MTTHQRRSDFFYDLPPDLIAQHPVEPRSASRLLHLGTSGVADRAIADLPDLLQPGDLLVFNDTRVIPARLFGQKPTGGRVEILVERVLGDREIIAQVGASKTPKPGGEILVADAVFRMIDRADDMFRLSYEGEGEGDVLSFLERVGQMPLPPYIHHDPDQTDSERYQTVFAREPGAVAAPTAGLHFDESLLARIRERGIRTATLTLHVGAGTFQPMRVELLSEHKMHAERFEVSTELVTAIAQTRERGGRVVAVGTTVTRALESAAAQGTLHAGKGETQIFITPGYTFKVVDLLLTNFHLPESTLMMLVSAFGGYERLMAAYRHAVEARYRFFSYGDAMLIEPLRG
ncbi:tRNA preQ1(34) S-adenosylmethionine ribosyltransferase-isomerase QueA [Stenotrophobium rhamnosiphilum]|uniref:S-adenosylmethionine:tRNA ribosyltransferase-isomerase n=1 Tax=Stenotrophobium rhamnosiphilum TaxID=2029166 RepID=A0A2T5MIN0_9GAMM|nr:tRNA preQ1(34) S-adenosylmethionine ribosyltransferase-isomerase QueA [Stenotrophobium rhamnosiphilum]PTU32399.1 tRNA preQ1(34) S-adenosylmethionine ribosyltransferase-isomerase QueA [Stenotrophobium rhamnosiphilum]